MHRQRALAAARAKRYRDRKKQGHVPRPVTQHSSEQYQTLFSTPYVELSEKDKALVRYHRRQARKQAHGVSSSSSPLPQSHQPSLQSPSQPESSFTTLTTAAEFSSTGTTLSIAPSNLLAEQPAITTATATSTILPCVLHSSTLLVHPYEQALIRSQLTVETTQLTQSLLSVEVPTQQWESYSNQLYTHVLSPHSRHKHMTHIVTLSEHDDKISSSSTGTTTGRYLSVYDVNSKHDIFPNPHDNILKEMMPFASRTHTRSSSQKVPSISNLQQALPLTMPTHKQNSYSHHRVPSPHSTPVLRTTTLTQEESYKRLWYASTLATQPPVDQHIFTPSININCITDPVIRRRLISIATAVQQQYKYSVQHKHQELECDHVFSSPLDGFGIDGLQVYFKSGECVTWLHDELLWCSALNYMLRESQGCALWIAVGLHDLKQVMSLSDIEKLLLIDKSKKNLMEVGTLLDTLVKAKVHIEYVLQKPGQLVSSPPGIGAAHFVYSHGILMTQLAWNYSFTIPGAIQCLSFWGIDDTHDHLANGNTSMATRTVLPLYTMQICGYDLGLMDQVHRYQTFIQQLQSQSTKRYTIKSNPRLSSTTCPTCLYRQDWIRINNQCIHCYYKKHHEGLK